MAPGGPPVMSGNSISTTPRAYGTASGQLNPSIYSTPQVVPSFNSVPQSLDALTEESDRGSLHFRLSSSNFSFYFPYFIACTYYC